MNLSRPFRFRATVLALWLFVTAAAGADDTFKVVHAYAHDRGAFTQGLVYLDGRLYESTGLKGQSSLRAVDVETGKLLQYSAIPAAYFGEGLAAWGDTLVELTWQDHVVLVYDRATFKLLRTIPYAGEGWGLTTDGKNLILSDGSATLHFLDPLTLREVRHVAVKSKGAAVDKLNELEYIHGEIYANIWYSDRIARIAPATGKVLGWVDLSGLLSPTDRSGRDAVLNGIAYDAEHDRLFVTGKLWPKLFEIKIVPEQRGK